MLQCTIQLELELVSPFRVESNTERGTRAESEQPIMHCTTDTAAAVIILQCLDSWRCWIDEYILRSGNDIRKELRSVNCNLSDRS